MLVFRDQNIKTLAKKMADHGEHGKFTLMLKHDKSALLAIIDELYNYERSHKIIQNMNIHFMVDENCFWINNDGKTTYIFMYIS